MEQLDMFSKDGDTDVSIEPKPFDAWDTSRDPDTPDRKRKASDNDRQPESPPEIERKHAPDNWHREKTFRTTTNTDPMETDSPASYPKHLMGSEPTDLGGGRYHHRDITGAGGFHDSIATVGGGNGATGNDSGVAGDAKLTTPILGTDDEQVQQGSGHGINEGNQFDTPSYPSVNSHYTQGSYQHDGGSFQGHTPPSKTGGHYLPDMDASPARYVTPQQPDVPMRPRRWACDYCNVATFVSYEEACAHEEQCARKYYERYGHAPHPSRGPVPQYDRQGQLTSPQQQQSGQEGQQQQGGSPNPVATTSANQGYGAVTGTPHHYGSGQEAGSRTQAWGRHGGPAMPGAYDGYHHSYHHANHGYHHSYHHGYHYPHHSMAHYHQQQQSHHQQHQAYYQAQNQRHGGYHSNAYDGTSRPLRRDPYQSAVVHTNSAGQHQKRMLLAMTTDSDSLSDRQCYVRSEMVEIFAATEKDVTARHSKGAQKLVEGQVGIRCVHCSHLRPRDRAERAVCYPSSISRIYQTVADMQRFHFEQCREIPAEIRKIYKGLKTTRPRGVGSPQTYWIQSAKLLDLVDSDCGIRFGAELAAEKEAKLQAAIKAEEQSQEEELILDAQTEDMSTSTSDKNKTDGDETSHAQVTVTEADLSP